MKKLIKKIFRHKRYGTTHQGGWSMDKVYEWGEELRPVPKITFREW